MSSTEGIIPARAGFTPIPTPHKSNSKDHPRSRGVYTAATQIAAPSSGSSPLARGLLQSERHTQLIIGIIPARAGFTAQW